VCDAPPSARHPLAPVVCSRHDNEENPADREIRMGLGVMLGIIAAVIIVSLVS
jgi:hypothetical protein